MNRASRFASALWAGPIAWFLTLVSSFAVSPWACGLRWHPALTVISLIGLLITFVFTLKCWNYWHEVGREDPGELGGETGVARALASGGVALNGVFFLVILAQLIASVVWGACE